MDFFTDFISPPGIKNGLRGQRVRRFPVLFPQKCAIDKSQRARILAAMVKRKNPAAVSLGKKGGRARTDQMTASERKRLARKAAKARWAKAKKGATRGS